MAKLNDFYGLCIKDGEKEKLHELCVKHQIPILYPELFENENEYYLWGIGQGVIA